MESGELQNTIVAAESPDATRSAFGRQPAIREALSPRAATVRDVPPLSLAWSLRYLYANLRTALPLAVADQVALAGALVGAAWGISRTVDAAAVMIADTGFALAIGLLLSFFFGRLYPGVGLAPRIEVRRCVGLTAFLFLLFSLATLTTGASAQSAARLALAGLLSLIMIPMFRHLAREVCGRFDWWTQPVLVLSDDPPHELRALSQQVLASRQLGWRPVAILSSNSSPLPGHDGSRSKVCSGSLQDINQVVGRNPVYRAMVATNGSSNPDANHLIEVAANWFGQVLLVRGISERELPWECSHTGALGDYRVFQLCNPLRSPTAFLVKRTGDLLICAVAGVVALPCMLIIAAAVKLSSAGPALYGQQRVGRGGKMFRVWKFRTMFSGAEEVLEDFLEGHPEFKQQWERERKLISDPRVVPYIGQFLRKSSLDELPQFWNVLKGEMSLVGPRPLPEYHLAQFDQPFRQYRAKVTPGITGLWQVSSRGNGNCQMYIECDSHYIRNWSLWLDLKILLRTFIAVLSGRGAS